MKTLRMLTAVAAIVALCGAPDALSRTIDERVYVMAGGAADERLVRDLKSGLPGAMPMSAAAEIESPMALPESAFDPQRGRYDARKIADAAAARVRIAVTNERILVVVDKDIFAGGADFVYGFNDKDKGVAVVSLARLGGSGVDRKTLTARALKAALHELGRSRKIEECGSPKCPMSAMAGPAGIDRMRDTYCYKCRVALEKMAVGGGLIGPKIEKMRNR